MAQVGEDHGIPECERGDLGTSLVRQWLTYDRKAILFLGENAILFVLGTTLWASSKRDRRQC